MNSVEIRDLCPGDEPAAEVLLHAELGGRYQARLGEMNDVLALHGVGAWEDDQLVGLATYAVGSKRAELAALAVTRTRRRRGIGGCLVEAVASLSAGAGADELWLVTTNDNLDVLRLYQRHGFHLTELHARAVDGAREPKPTIPLLGQHGIPLRDELVLTRPMA